MAVPLLFCICTKVWRERGYNINGSSWQLCNLREREREREQSKGLLICHFKLQYIQSMYCLVGSECCVAHWASQFFGPPHHKTDHIALLLVLPSFSVFMYLFFSLYDEPSMYISECFWQLWSGFWLSNGTVTRSVCEDIYTASLLSN